MPLRALTGSTRLLLRVALIGPALLIILLAFAAYRTESEVRQSSTWVTHTFEVQTAIHGLASSLVDAETGQRGFLLTHREDFLEPYQAGVAGVEEQLRSMGALTADNPAQQQRLSELEPLVHDRLNVLADTIAQEKRGEHDAAIDAVNSGRGKYLMDKIRGVLRLMGNEEARLLSLRQEQLANDAERQSLVMPVLSAGALALAVATAYLLRRLSRITPLITMCAESRTIEHNGEWLTFEEYLRQRFGILTSHGLSPEEAAKWRLKANELIKAPRSRQAAAR